MAPYRGCLIGRFQPFHRGHRKLAEYVADDVDELVVGIGSADASHTRRNPFTAGERVMMVRKTLEPFDITDYVVPIEDLDRNSVWVSHVQSMAPEFDVAYSNNPLVIRLFSEAGIEVRQTEMFDRDELKGSEIRRQMIDGEDWRQHVPQPVQDVIDEVDGVGRLRDIE
ncbi:nicotinamide-nucleotide adenylyltransferase [Halovenus sp. WSH3]|uniref:Nicotinamide-nucleotide adenylyltransferase n=1 Tax=Halovenus carboxidivorans TaxID=2692199 RepID=A0A6B0TAW6_9EURY|nr:nicotinamide-nucleotide adenylyltransferase [Halovenus carboxidivorans]MXR52361.1 nicotinamide-nucleotide adenylyltransferase [Halovenus carboxidivorans]